MIERGNRVLPNQIFFWHFRTEVPRFGTHVAVHQLEPGTGKGVRKLIRMFQESPRDLFVGGIKPQREVGGQHVRRDPLRSVVRMWHRALTSAVLRPPLMGASRAL